MPSTWAAIIQCRNKGTEVSQRRRYAMENLNFYGRNFGKFGFFIAQPVLPMSEIKLIVWRLRVVVITYVILHI